MDDLTFALGRIFSFAVYFVLVVGSLVGSCCIFDADLSVAGGTILDIIAEL